MTIKDHKPPTNTDGRLFTTGFTPNFTDYKSWGMKMLNPHTIQRVKPEQSSSTILGIKQLEARGVSPAVLKNAEKLEGSNL